MELLFLILGAALAVILYVRALNSRKYYVCPQCGNKFRTEYMESKHCEVCGSEVVES